MDDGALPDFEDEEGPFANYVLYPLLSSLIVGNILVTLDWIGIAGHF